MEGQYELPGAHPKRLPPTNVRVLNSSEELAAAIERAEDGAKRLRDRLAARAARDEWTATHTEQCVGWKRFVRGSSSEQPLVLPDAAPPRHHDVLSRREARSFPAA